ncbi:MAG: InlB B-repeat-containing protein, partial [Oscillibacter sp.]|nr:InlB B-repeat-containing protein [Oscillibacter sp.]
ANGTGDSYEAGDVYDRDENITLYARWELATYTVTLNPNHGELLEESVTVTYSQPYGEIPVPSREQYEFAGWYTELDGGERITEQSTVTLTEDQTLYAHWDSTIAYISSFVTRMGSYHVVHTTAYRITNGVLLVCGYLNGQMVDVASGEPGNSDGVTLDGDFDTIRVFAVDADTHKPLCPRNTILERDFRG